MVDPRLEPVARVVARVEGKARWLARLATRAAVVGGVGALVVWSVVSAGRLTEWWQGTVASLLVLALLAAPTAWLVNVRFALLELLKLPEKLAGVTTRRAGQLLRTGARPADAPVERPDGGPLGAARSVWGVLRTTATWPVRGGPSPSWWRRGSGCSPGPPFWPCRWWWCWLRC